MYKNKVVFMNPKNAIVIFENVSVRKVWADGEIWISALDVAKALDYENPSMSVSAILKRNQEKLKDYTKCRYLDSEGGKQKSWLLNLKGVIAFCMLSNQPKAIPFQRWAIEILEKHINQIPSEIKLIATTRRVKFTDQLRDHGINKPHQYINITKSMKQHLDIDQNKPKTECDLIEVMKIAAAEDIARINLLINNPNGYYETKPICDKSANIVKIGTEKQPLALTAKEN